MTSFYHHSPQTYCWLRSFLTPSRPPSARSSSSQPSSSRSAAFPLPSFSPIAYDSILAPSSRGTNLKSTTSSSSRASSTECTVRLSLLLRCGPFFEADDSRRRHYDTRHWIGAPREGWLGSNSPADLGASGVRLFVKILFADGDFVNRSELRRLAPVRPL